MSAQKYFNIPIALFKSKDLKDILSNGVRYAVYAHSQLMLFEGNEFKSAANFLGVSFNNLDSAEECGKQLFDLYQNSPKAGVNSSIFWDYYNNDKSEYQIDCFRAYCATRSIIGEKAYCKSNKALIHARMFGYSSSKELPKKLSKHQEKYTIRYHMDKVLLSLQHDWYLKLVSQHSRGLYISYDLSLEDLMVHEEKSKKKTKDNQLKDAKAIARVNALARVATTTHKIDNLLLKPIKKTESLNNRGSAKEKDNSVSL